MKITALSNHKPGILKNYIRIGDNVNAPAYYVETGDRYGFCKRMIGYKRRVSQ